MLNKELLLCSKGEEVPVKYEYTVDGLAPSMGIGGIQPGLNANKNVKTPYWGDESHYFEHLQSANEEGYKDTLLKIVSDEPVFGDSCTLKLWFPNEYKECVLSWKGGASYYNYYYADGVEILDWAKNLGEKVILEFPVPPDGYIIK